VRAVRSTGDGVGVVSAHPSGDGVRVAVASSSICGTDLHLIGFGPSAVTLGHEFSGRLDDGTPVAVLPRVACGRCERCRAGQEHQCPSAFGSMYGISLDGGLADEAWVVPACAKVLPDRVPVEDACLVEPLAVAVHGIHRAGVTAGSRVLVVGGGPIGLCAVAVVRSLGADVDLLARHQSRIEAGERLGAGTAPGDGYDVVLEAAGTQQAVDTAIERCRPGGTVGVLSTFWEPVRLGVGFQIKEVTLVPAFTYGHHHGGCEFEEAAAILGRHPDLPGAVITHHFPLEDATEAFRLAADRDSGAIKVALHP